MKIFICGYGNKNRSKDNPQSTGKDIAAEYISKKTGLTFKGSSEFAAQHIIYPKYKEQFNSWQECFETRHQGNNRKLWYDEICKFNIDDPAKLSRLIFSHYDIYVGNRNIKEIEAYKQEDPHVLCIWIDASKRVEPETSASISVSQDDCDIIIDNNGTIEEFYKQLDQLIKDLQNADSKLYTKY